MYLSEEQLLNMVDTIYNTLRPPYLSQDDEEDMRQEIALGILEGDALVKDTNSAEAFLYEYGLGYGRKYLQRSKIPYDNSTVNISSVNSLGLETSDVGHCYTLDWDYDLCLLGRTIDEVDREGWVKSYLGMECKQKSITDIARDSGMSRPTVHKYIDKVLGTVRSRLSEAGTCT